MKYDEYTIVYAETEGAPGFISATEVEDTGEVSYMVEFIHERDDGTDLRHEWLEEDDLRPALEEHTAQFERLATSVGGACAFYLSRNLGLEGAIAKVMAEADDDDLIQMGDAGIARKAMAVGFAGHSGH